jgi:hypothetical protein
MTEQDWEKCGCCDGYHPANSGDCPLIRYMQQTAEYYGHLSDDFKAMAVDWANQNYYCESYAKALECRAKADAYAEVSLYFSRLSDAFQEPQP